MKLIEMMQARAGEEQSYFRAALLREDMGRLEKLERLAGACDSLEQFEKIGLYIGWTKGDLRTGELKQALLPLMTAIYSQAGGGKDEASENKIIDAWADFNTQRMKILIHCL